MKTGGLRAPWTPRRKDADKGVVLALLRYAKILPILLLGFVVLTIPAVLEAPGTPTLVLFLVVMLCAWFSGFGPGILATIVFILATAPKNRPFWSQPQLRMALFAAAGAMVSGLIQSLKNSRRKAFAHAESLKAIIDASVDHIHVIDLEGHYLHVSHGAARAVERTPEEYVGRTWVELGLPADVMEPFDALRASVLESGEPWRGEMLSQTSQGRRYFEYIITPVRESRAIAPNKVIVISRDITDRKLADQANAHLAAIVDSSEDAIIGKDLDGIVTSWNAGAERLFGYSAVEMIATPIDRLIPQDRKPEEPAILERLRRGERVESFESVRVAKDGRRIEVSLTISPIRDASGDVIGASKIVRDITERKQAEAAQGRLATIIEYSDDSVVSEDLDGNIVTWNASAQRIFGYTRDEAIGHPIDSILISPEKPGEARDQLDMVLRGETVRNFETRRLRKDGSLVDVSVTVSLIRNLAGEVIGVARIHRDITNRLRAEAAQRESERLARSVLDSLSANIAVLGESGNIIAVNRAWEAFAEANGAIAPVGVGANYLDACDSATVLDHADARAVASAIREVLASERDTFELEYPCHSPTELRWFIGRLTPFQGEGPRRLVVSHQNITGRKQAEEQLRDRERMLAQSQKMAHVGSWELVLEELSDASRSTLRWSDECYRIFGYEPGEVAVSNDLFFMAVPEVDRNAVSFTITRSLQEKQSYQFEHQITRPDGTRRTVQEWGELVTDSKQHPIRMVGTCQDITERKLAEAAVRESEARLRLFVEHAPASIAMLDAQMCYLATSNRWLTDYGLTGQDLRGLNHYTLFPEIPERWRDIYLRCLEGAVERDEEDRLDRADGRTQWLRWEVRPWYTGSGGVGGIVIFTEDITERKQADEALRRYADRLESLRAIDLALLSAQSPEKIAWSALEHLARLVPCWTGAAVLYHFDQDEMEVLSSIGLALERNPSRIRVSAGWKDRDELVNLQGGNVVVVDDVLGTTLKGRLVESFMNPGLRSYLLVPLIDRAALIGVLMMGSDVPGAYSADDPLVTRAVADRLAIAIRQALLHAEILSSKERLEIMSRRLILAEEVERRRIARELHDETGQGLMALKINLQAIRKNPTIPTVISRLEESLGLVDRTIGQVRSLSTDLRPSLLDDFGLVVALQAACNALAQRLGIKVEFLGDPMLGRFNSEIETVCYRIVQEATNNIGKYAQAGEIRVRLGRSGDNLSLEIEDDGIGFDVEAAQVRATGGASFGVLGMRERAELAGGSLTIESRKGRGTVVRATLPCRAPGLQGTQLASEG